MLDQENKITAEESSSTPEEKKVTPQVSEKNRKKNLQKKK